MFINPSETVTHYIYIKTIQTQFTCCFGGGHECFMFYHILNLLYPIVWTSGRYHAMHMLSYVILIKCIIWLGKHHCWATYMLLSCRGARVLFTRRNAVDDGRQDLPQRPPPQGFMRFVRGVSAYEYEYHRYGFNTTEVLSYSSSTALPLCKTPNSLKNAKN